MADDPRVHWDLGNPFGILIDEAADTGWSGRVFGMRELDGGDAGVLIASETGGARLVDDGGDAFPLSNDWTNPDLDCLAAGPDGPRHFLFSPGIWWSGLSLKRLGSLVHCLQINSYGVRPFRVLRRRLKLKSARRCLSWSWLV
jgi:hypothetical protein